MNKEDRDKGYFKAHTTEVTIDGEKQRVATIYLDNLQKSLGKRLTITAEQEKASDDYLKADKARVAEVNKVTNAAKRNAAKVAAKKK